MTPPRVWTIAGSDSSGGAGIQADLRVFQAFGVSAGTVVTAITAQNRSEVISVSPVEEKIVADQCRSLLHEGSPAGVKIGLIGSSGSVEVIRSFLAGIEGEIILDPVMAASSGRRLCDGRTVSAIRNHLFPIATLLTPNCPEASEIVGFSVDSPDRIEQAANVILSMGPQAVLVKGGHLIDDWSRDFWTDGKTSVWLASPRSSTVARGTGCQLSSAILAGSALGHSQIDSLVMAKIYLNRVFREKKTSVFSYSPEDSFAPSDLPSLSKRYLLPFGTFSPTREIGLYPIVDRKEKLRVFSGTGVRHIQLRIKDLRGRELENEIRGALIFANDHNICLWVNDCWDLALQNGARAVHLGQEDLKTANIEALSKAGMLLGLSTHNFEELARAHTLRPSYVALGPIFPTTSKPMVFGAQGLDRLRLWRNLVDYGLVAIGGITLERAKEVANALPDGVAVLSALNDANEDKIKQWLHEMNLM